MSDKERIDWLERQAKKPGGLLLHAEKGATGRNGLGISPGHNRDLRDAIDDAMGVPRRNSGSAGESR